ncbi:MAG TPA: FecR domain-containing protein, partial [Chitinophagaceae bacterium]|nr:FecR domain-containing protein [Chitinophagaceae bacterium]
AVQENINIIKRGDGQLIYSANQSIRADGSEHMNTLTVPRGSRPLQLTLTDGTKIWLNAAASIIYPVVFSGDERKVQITGEAYFEVAKDATRKFYVSANGIETEVLGTHFNINAYEDETNVKITLLEGSINVSAPGSLQHLAPGQQAKWENKGTIKVLNDVDTDEVMAWKEGVFDFNGMDMKSVMRQLARWYNVEVEYQGKIKEIHFSGIINRSNNISQVLKMLQSTGGIGFRVETGSSSGRAGKIIVLPG